MHIKGSSINKQINRNSREYMKKPLQQSISQRGYRIGQQTQEIPVLPTRIVKMKEKDTKCW